MEDDVIDLVEDSDLMVSPMEVEIVDSAADLESSNTRRERRNRRALEKEEALHEEQMVVSEGVVDESILPEIPAIGNQMSCRECGSRIVTKPGVMSTKCPVCGARVDL